MNLLLLWWSIVIICYQALPTCSDHPPPEPKVCCLQDEFLTLSLNPAEMIFVIKWCCVKQLKHLWRVLQRTLSSMCQPGCGLLWGCRLPDSEWAVWMCLRGWLRKTISRVWSKVSCFCLVPPPNNPFVLVLIVESLLFPHHLSVETGWCDLT